jgi:cytochrome c-type biogenesis protein CcmH
LKKSSIAWLALVAVVAIAMVALVVGSGPSSSPSSRAARLANELACPVCSGESVADSNAPASRSIRADIVRRIDAGQSDAEIRDAYVARYGEHVLLTPDSGGLGVIAWGLPVLVIVLGAGGIVLAIRRGSRTPRLAASPADVALVAEARAAEHPDEALDGPNDGLDDRNGA